MNKKKISVTIENPCHEDVGKMPRREGGMYCARCEKVVRDFSILSDPEIIKLLTQKNPGEMCGKFRNDQVNRDLIALPEKRYSFRPAKILLMSLFSFKFISP